MSFPWKNILPLVRSTSLSTSFPRVVFPLPLSPARANISPLPSEKLTRSTALTLASTLDSRVSMKPLRKGYHLRRFSTLRTSPPTVVSVQDSIRESFLSEFITKIKGHFLLMVQVARDCVPPFSIFFQHGFYPFTNIHDVWASRVEPAA